MEEQYSRAAVDVDRVIQRAQDYLLGVQYSEGFWWGELETNPTMEAEYLLLTHFLGVADKDTWRKLANHIKGQQAEDGTWDSFTTPRATSARRPSATSR